MVESEYTVRFEAKALKSLDELPQRTRGRILEKLKRLQKVGLQRVSNVKKLRQPLSGYRLRVGDYRILLTASQNVYTVYSISHRRDAY